ncbi:helix-turn-helix transcriptional regulator [Sutcliffiella horikoshii]|uniref:helix-turn-helix domain-containing protein n=1 Tax=Sutcliffiella horikoshii TaxID=79883 RepID=UPI002041F25C|nr:helix-turn-helix transcriptional regulator [Sutcliffiella horikoshii]MCM3619820.1 helix-turn-helix transcriptional regulator [Sutcliffiella horikoshii]
MTGVRTKKRKRKTPFGRYLEEHGIKQVWLAESAKVSEGLISQLANDKERVPTIQTAKMIIKVLKKHDRYIDPNDFW